MLEIFGTTDYEKDLIRVYEKVSQVVSFPKKVCVNLTFVSKEEIRELNKITRNIDKVTDVLTYPYVDLTVGKKLKISDYKESVDLESGLLTIGDIYICLDRAKEQAEEYNHTLRREVCFLLCHGLLHIAGYDHIEKSDEGLMTAKQEEIMNELNITREQFKCGFVTIVGETNAGKSTLINQLVGEHVAIVSPKSQTTRENIQGIYNDKTTQIVFVDTPGYHKRANKIDDEMEKHIATAQEDTEIVLMLIVANKPLVEQYNKLNKKVSADAKKILLINKIDETKYEKLYPQLMELSAVAKVDEILPISAMNGKNVDVLLDMVKKFLPSYDFEMRYYPVDEYTDKNLRHMVAEIVREKALLCLDDEIPHGIQVVVNSYVESESPIPIYADLYCEKESHKAIILGKNGEMIKKISTMARKHIEKIVGEQINLQVYVKVKPNWRNDEKAIQEFGLSVGE
ncbi:MAG: GTPase Era [Clostridia bacterium]|nr:GTPase Era [Clostridia bacterium]